jgi:hypothetical protein
MRTSAHLKFAACGTAAVAVVAAFAAPSQAQGGKNAPTETGCYDITEGTFDFTRDRQYDFFNMTPAIEHSADAQALATHTHSAETSVRTYTSAFSEDATALVVATTANTTGLDCSGVRYRLRIFDESHALITEIVVPGGTTDKVTWKTGFPYPDSEGLGRAAYFSGTTETSTGRVVDTAPDASDGLLVELDGSPATSAFK